MDSSQNKVILVGNTNVGKTCIVKKAIYDEFQENSSSTVAPHFYDLKKEVNGRMITLHIYDTAGQERFMGLSELYYRDASAVIIVYAINDLQSFQDVEKWYDSVFQRLGKDRTFIYLVANKSDLYDQNDVSVVSVEDGKQKAKDLDMDFICVSAKSGSNINDLFELIATQIEERQDSNNASHDTERPKVVDLTKGDSEEKKKCC